ncbi:hypothetical protein FSBG_00832 [Fusobacterium gonidiaformans 3-1-5R]|uniref:DUF2273 domain-containing protein n=2 Tax=Fusobacterium TaxID=848 RepID=E5BE59_9FUSO|nr:MULTISPECIES: DUF2273 domain-containing protein [Fusobacterium]AVQ17433.1 DUF2273 domain-containing protein [Fusobacterium gonidiaformans ATCC 25563]EFS21335.1 hypothetical protein FSBG_00832 [Fusobacterium gonidiaformans 3-1-5R]EFS27785.1 hypothetical protein FGAG_00106 [Fusobacterium gonidiaformans ATCC 25563]KXA15850.1 hypothetical protein HMPREF3206_00527 [Fusobacterium equinum]
MLEEYIARFVLHMSQSYRKYIGGFFGFLIGVLWLQFGFFPMLFVCLCAILGYKLGDLKIQKKIKRKILEKLKED